jgi:hypothetical protein
LLQGDLIALSRFKHVGMQNNKSLALQQLSLSQPTFSGALVAAYYLKFDSPAWLSESERFLSDTVNKRRSNTCLKGS